MSIFHMILNALCCGILSSFLAGILIVLGFMSVSRPDDAPHWPMFKNFAAYIKDPANWPWLHALQKNPQQIEPPTDSSLPARKTRLGVELSCFALASLYAFFMGEPAMPMPLAMAALIAVAISAGTVDWHFLMLSDEMNVLMAFIAFALMAAGGWPTIPPMITAGLLLILGLLLAFGYGYLRGREVLGMGDVKLMTASGFWIMPEQIPLYLIIAGLCGIVLNLLWRRLGRGEASPFGPALLISLLYCVVLHGQHLF